MSISSAILNNRRYHVLTANTNNINLKTVLGDPTGPIRAIIVLPLGRYIYSNGSGASLQTGSFAAGSLIHFINNGIIYGSGGDGGGVGSNGGDAISMQCDLMIDNTNGYIFAGGGGGGGGWACPGIVFTGGGGGGGAGQGYIGATGGGGSYGADAGGNSNIDGPGGGGGGTAGDSGSGGSGGAGGTWGQSGQNGGTNCLGFTGDDGGAGGRAVVSGGNTLTWLGGYNSTQVKGNIV